MSWSRLRTLLLPGFVFQSVVIAGGYGTGRELVEFFLSRGPVDGLLSMLTATIIWSAVCAVSLEYARRFRAYDYRNFFRHLLGRGWVLFEVCYVTLLLLVLGVIAAAAGSIVQDRIGLPYAVGVTLMMVSVGGVVLGGTERVERVLAVWSAVLYVCFFTLVALSFRSSGELILDRLAIPLASSTWVGGGIRYAAYNLAVIPAILFVARHLEGRRDAVTAGLLAGPIAMMPGLFFYLALLSAYPLVLDSPVPADTLLSALGIPPFQWIFHLVLFGTLIETGAGLIHAVNQRIESVLKERGGVFQGGPRVAVAAVLLLMGAGLARFGLVDLIAKGYGALTWAFLLIFVVPVLTLGPLKLQRSTRKGPGRSSGPDDGPP